MKRGANLTADSFAFGNAGNIIIKVRDLFLSRDGAKTGSIATQSTRAGDAGTITIKADRIEINEGRITATTNGSGKGGFVDVTAEKSLTISGADGGIISLTAPPSTSVANLTPGNGGQISVTTPSLVMNAGTRIDSSTLWDGDAGQIAGEVGNLTLNDGAQIRSQSGGEAVTTGQPSVGFGKGGSVTLKVDDAILITGSNSAVSTTTFGNGDAGNILLKANQVNIQNGGSVTSESGGTLAGRPSWAPETPGKSVYPHRH